MDRRRLVTLIVALFAFTACATPTADYGQGGSINVSAAQATYVAAANVATAQAAQAQHTAVAQAEAERAWATAVAQSTRDTITLTAESVSIRATVQALDVVSTREAIASNATATAVSMVAEVERRIVSDEAARLAIQREKDRAAVQQGRIWSIVWQVVSVLVGVGLAAVGVAFAYATFQRTKPIIVRRSATAEADVLVYTNGGYRQLAPQRPMQTAGLLPAGDEVTAGARELPALPEGHVLIAGNTRSGKTTALRAVAKTRENVVILDPHYRPGTWPGLRVVGGGRDYESIQTFMAYMMDELRDRAQMRAMGGPDAPPLTVMTDEMPSITAALGNNANGVWQAWLREGWKFGLFFIIGTHSTRVKTLGIEGEGDVLVNFANVILLGKVARNEYPELVAGMQRPAVLIPAYDDPYPVVIPYDPAEDPDSPYFGQESAPPLITRPAPPQNNLPRPMTQAERDGRLLEPHLDRLTSPTNAGRVLGQLKGMLAEGVNPSAEMIDEARAALEWRVRNLGCEKARAVLEKARVRPS